MNRDKILEQLKMDTNGWNPVELYKWSQKSFYTYMLEHNDFCLAWLAIVKYVSEKSLVKHHFERRNTSGTVSPNAMPRLLIVTNGTRWFLSKHGAAAFTEVRFDAVLMSMYDETRKYADAPLIKTYDRMVEIELRTTMYELKKAVRDKGAKKAKKEAVPDLFSGSGSVNIEPSYKAMYEVTKMRTDVMENMLNSKLNETIDLKMILHHHLASSYNSNSLRLLADVASAPGKHFYVNPFSYTGDLVIKILNHEMYSKEFKEQDLSGKFLLIKNDGEITEIEADGDNAKTLLKPGLFKLNSQLLNELLNNRTNEK